ncbi:PIN domain-containing protein [Phenylobacterium sp.]|uniref:PIN domain-containing protein n=1 Tax=Phenylobacterium sp. TaxID=1871053 RepID=UPI0035B31575
MTRTFFDTNVLLYLLSADPDKADRAEALLSEGGVVSVQVLNEFAAVATRKFGASWDAVRETLDVLRLTLDVEPLTLQTHQLGLAIAERHRLGLYDSMILAAAALAGCEAVYSEDMQDGFRLPDGPTVRNPFTPPR